ncbi:MAG: glutamine synthetase family protein [Rhodobacteraceae bacterium]|nr:glutamine synthetase family protein [Paracoccaceae bacterium]
MARLRDGALAALGLMPETVAAAGEDLLARVATMDLETLRVVFVDQHGVLRGKTVVADAMASVLANGLGAPSTLVLKDTSHRTVFPVWSGDAGIASGPMNGANDMLLVPDARSFRVLPWSPHSAWILCDLAHKSGAPIPFSPRRVLASATESMAAQGLSALVGLEVEFHIFEVTDPRRGHADAAMPGAPMATRNMAQGYQYLTETRYSELEPVLDLLRRHAVALDLPLRSMEIEMGPSQVEFTFEPASPMRHADNMVMFRTLVKEVCAARGLHGTFMAKPALENVASSGWHIHQSVTDAASGRNLFMPADDGGLSAAASGWIAGLLEHAEASCLLTAPTVNSYKRYGAYQLAPNRIQWGHDNRGAMVRALMAPGDAASRVENRVADATATPHYAFAAQLLSGLDGVARGLRAPEPSLRPYDSTARTLPATLGDAIAAFDGSGFYRSALGDETVDYLVHLKRAEWNRYLATVSDWEQAEYFNLF